MANIFDQFQNLIARFNQERLDYAVCGGWAMAIHGIGDGQMKVDMSPPAVKARLKLVSQHWRLSLSLGKARKETDARRNVGNSSKIIVVDYQEKVI